MKRQLICLVTFLFSVYQLQAQEKPLPHISQFADITLTAGNAQGAAAISYVYNWRLGKTRKWELGLGGRLTSYLGRKQDFITSPARLSRSTTTPFLIVFAGQKTENWDTLQVQRPLTTSVNITANIGYHFNARWYAGFNIDVIGFTTGRTTSSTLASNGINTTEPVTKPAGFNLLLTGDNDLGSLNSEFFVRYQLNNRFAIKAVYQFLFIEYKTTTTQQIAPDGTRVDRFRNKVNAFGLGLTYTL